jgi:acetyltransferase-like isoleucine patch superfamily enzyme
MAPTNPTGRERVVPAALLGLLPPSRFKNFLLRTFLKWDVDPSVQVGPCVFFGVKRVLLGPHARLASFSVYRDLEVLRVARNCRIGHWNYVTAARELRTPALDSTPNTQPATLELEDSAVITSRHYIDCSGGVHVGAFTVLAGVRSTVMSHHVDVSRCEQAIASVNIGRHCLLGSNVTVVPGTRIPDSSYIAMGSVVTGELRAAETLYAGVPAQPVRHIGDQPFFKRRYRRANIP